MTHQQETLSQGWNAIACGSQKALDWVETVRQDSRRLDNEADKLNLSLHRARNLASSLMQVATTPMTVGFFGISQAGKSYLISALAAGNKGILVGEYGGKQVDFIKEVNPVGGGKEATGLVTRFTRNLPDTPLGFPVPLRLFSEIDLAKILANTWFNDFNHEQLTYQLDEERIESKLRPFEQRHAPTSSYTGVSRDDVVALWDYLNSSFRKSVEKLEHAYWPRVLKLAPTLSPSERAELFSLLWGEQPALTATYRTLACCLDKLKHANTVFAPLDCLLSQSSGSSIMNVDSLNRLGAPEDRQIEIRYSNQDGHQFSSASLSQAELAALTTELIFPLTDVPQNSLMEQVDLLDFPGYRGRLAICTLDEINNTGNNPVSQLLLRGKVAYLFERYTDNQEMNALVVCASSVKQSDVTSVGPVLTRWVEKTQGATSSERKSRKPGLFWAITMCDMRITQSLGLTTTQFKEGWEGLMQQTLLERFGQYDWLQEWLPGTPFNNCFLVRKPGMPVPFLNLQNQPNQESQAEIGIASQYSDVLQQMASTFAASKSVEQHIANPKDAWQSMLELNDGGMARLTTALRNVAHLDFKLSRIDQQLQNIRKDLGEHQLGRWYQQEGDQQFAIKQAVAKQLWDGLSKRVYCLGELINSFDLPTSELHNIYLSIRNTVQEAESKSEMGSIDAFGNDSEQAFNNNPFGDSPFGSSPFESSSFGTSSPMTAPPSPTPEASQSKVRVGQDDNFAHNVFVTWVAHLRDLSTRSAIWNQLKIEKELVGLLTEEIITAANRLDLEGTLKRSLAGQEQAGVRREQLLTKQVMKAQLALRDFIAWFGFLSQPPEKVPNSYVGSKGKVFARTHMIAPDELPHLPATASDPSLQFLGDWISALVVITQENAGHSAGRDISSEQNKNLGQIISLIKQE